MKLSSFHARRLWLLLFAVCLLVSPVLGADKDVSKENARSAPQWIRDGVIYEIFPRHFSEKGDLNGAIAEYRTVLRLQPTHTAALLNLGAALQANGDLDGAIAMYRHLLSLQPERARARYNLGVALQAKGDLDGAIEQYRVLVNLRQDYALGFYALGEALAQKGLRKEAAAALRDYLAKEKDTPDTHQRVERARAHLKELGS